MHESVRNFSKMGSTKKKKLTKNKVSEMKNSSNWLNHRLERAEHHQRTLRKVNRNILKASTSAVQSLKIRSIRMVKSTTFEVRVSGFKSRFYHFLDL